MYNIIKLYGDVVLISNGCYRLSTLNSKTVQYNIIMIKHFPQNKILRLSISTVAGKHLQ